jgi:hypothetical protein
VRSIAIAGIWDETAPPPGLEAAAAASEPSDAAASLEAVATEASPASDAESELASLPPPQASRASPARMSNSRTGVRKRADVNTAGLLEARRNAEYQRTEPALNEIQRKITESAERSGDTVFAT